RLSNVQRTTTLAAFISSRYGNNLSLGSLVTIMCFSGIIPYISLQLKAISESFDVIVGSHAPIRGSSSLFSNTSFYVVMIMAGFTLLFGARRLQTNEKHEGMMAAIAFESVVKLLAFLIIGIYITYFVFDGFSDIFSQAIANESTSKLLVMPHKTNYREWFWITLLSAIAFTLLPRQFQVAVVENQSEEQLKPSMWKFPFYLLLINLFVLPIAIAGMLLFKNSTISPDYYILQIPLLMQNKGMALLAFIGGISAATSMIIVETMALSTMFSNNLVMPLIVGNDRLKKRYTPVLNKISIWSRRLSILLILFLAYLYYLRLNQYYSLVSIGLISFVSVAQFSPAMIGGMFWKKATKVGALSSILTGFAIWLYTLIIPSLMGNQPEWASFIQNGPWGISILKPGALFGLEGFGPISHAMFWTMFFNIAVYIIVSLNTSQDVNEQNQAEIFVDIFKYSAIYESSVILKGKASLADINDLLSQFFGSDRTKQVIRLFAKKHQIDVSDPGQVADQRIIAYSERLLSGVIGSASARIMISGIVDEGDIKLDEVVNILKESQQIISNNRELIRKSSELKQAMDQLAEVNLRLEENDKMKDDFLSTVTHELRTPITSIRAFSEILYDNPDFEFEDRQHYLGIVIKETERISRLISQVLDLERYESGRQKLTLSKVHIDELMKDVLESMDQLIKEKKATTTLTINSSLNEIICDRDKITQVLINLISNALKFVEDGKGIIGIDIDKQGDCIQFKITDNGKGIQDEFKEMIFEKFFQAKNQLTRKPKGSGLGLAICKKILDLHKGDITVSDAENGGAVFSFTFPISSDTLIYET
ncbi:MAG: ATP-binding protein, partial [Chitinophagaceae bacterium]